MMIEVFYQISELAQKLKTDKYRFLMNKEDISCFNQSKSSLNSCTTSAVINLRQNKLNC